MELRDRVEQIAFSSVFNAVLIVGIAAVAIDRALSDGFHLAGGSIPEQVRDLVWFSLACGLASTATIEIFKRLTPIRGLYQRRQSALWLKARRPAEARPEKEDLYKPLQTAMRLRTRAELTRIFNLPTEQLAAQISSAADAALTAPDEQKWFLEALTGVTWRTAEQATQAGGDSPPALDLQLVQRVRSGVDHFQIDATERWRRYVQGAALWISALYGILLAHAGIATSSTRPAYVLAALVLGGSIAWFARDITAFVQRGRR
jgi:hypothetical protein